jgi:hypothetical protein
VYWAAADLLAEDSVNEAVLFDAREAGKARRDDRGTKMIAAAGPVLNLRLSPRNGGLNARFDIYSVRHDRKV